MAMWVASAVLVQPDADMQRKVASKFIEVANFCKLNGDAASCVAIMQGFALHEVSRLRRTWHLTQDRWAFARACDTLATHTDNFGVLRAYILKRLRENMHCVPHLVGYQKVLQLIEEGNPDYTLDDTVNVTKLAMIGNQLCEVQEFQEIVPKGYAESAARRSSQLASVLYLLPARGEVELRALSGKQRPYPSDATVVEEGSAWSSEASGTVGVNDESSSGHSENFIDV